VIVIGEAYGKPGEGVDGELKPIVSGARALVATLGCGDLVIDVQMYFSPSEIDEGEELITPSMVRRVRPNEGRGTPSAIRHTQEALPPGVLVRSKPLDCAL